MFTVTKAILLKTILTPVVIVTYGQIQSLAIASFNYTREAQFCVNS